MAKVVYNFRIEEETLKKFKIYAITNSKKANKILEVLIEKFLKEVEERK